MKANPLENRAELEHILACPACRSSVKVSPAEWSCRNCKKEWPIDGDGVVRLSESDQFFGADQQGMRKLLEEMRNMSAEEFFGDMARLEEAYRDFQYDYCLDPARADWTVLEDLQDKIVVDLGCGYGTVSLPVAPRAKMVIGVDHTLERVKFFSLVAGFRGVANITAIHGNVFELPFREEAVDVFVCMGLLEYAGTWKQGARPIEVQKEFLACLYRCLSKNGRIWIGIENRLNPAYLIGKTHHGDIPFTALMPRAVANAVSWLCKGEPYRTWTHGQRGYVKLLQAVGFEGVELYYPFPGYQKPRFIVPSTERRVFSRMVRNPGFGSGGSITHKVGIRLYRTLDRIGLLGVFAPTFLIRGIKRL